MPKPLLAALITAAITIPLLALGWFGLAYPEITAPVCVGGGLGLLIFGVYYAALGWLERR